MMQSAKSEPSVADKCASFLQKPANLSVMAAAALGVMFLLNRSAQGDLDAPPASPEARAVLNFQFDGSRVGTRGSASSAADGPRKIFLDLGTNQGSVIEAFYEGKHSPDSNNPRWTFAVDGYDPKEWQVYGFEASPSHDTRLDALEEKYNNVGDAGGGGGGGGLKIFHPVALWDSSTETVKLNIDDNKQHAEWGSSVFEGKKKFSSGVFECPTVDFAEFLKAHVRPEDTVVLKANIEGAEFPIFRKLVQQKLLCLIDYIDIYWHLQFFEGKEKQNNKAFVDLVRNEYEAVCNSKIHLWSVHGAAD